MSFFIALLNPRMVGVPIAFSAHVCCHVAVFIKMWSAFCQVALVFEIIKVSFVVSYGFLPNSQGLELLLSGLPSNYGVLYCLTPVLFALVQISQVPYQEVPEEAQCAGLAPRDCFQQR